MTDHDLDKLLGGFAADTLTPEERRKLYQAAIDDQQLFNALADEQALKELLIDPAVRQRLLETLRRPAPDERRSGLSWLDWFRRPAGLAFAGGLAAALFTLVFGTRIFEEGLKQSSQPAATEEARPTALQARRHRRSKRPLNRNKPYLASPRARLPPSNRSRDKNCRARNRANASGLSPRHAPSHRKRSHRHLLNRWLDRRRSGRRRTWPR